MLGYLTLLMYGAEGICGGMMRSLCRNDLCINDVLRCKVVWRYWGMMRMEYVVVWCGICDVVRWPVYKWCVTVQVCLTWLMYDADGNVVVWCRLCDVMTVYKWCVTVQVCLTLLMYDADGICGSMMPSLWRGDLCVRDVWRCKVVWRHWCIALLEEMVA